MSQNVATTQSGRAELRNWLRFIRSESHILSELPELLFQQAANQPDSKAPALRAQVRWRTGIERRRWVQWLNKPQFGDPCTMTLIGHSFPAIACAFSPDGRFILTASLDGTVKTWSSETGETVLTVDLEAFNRSLGQRATCAFSPDCTRIVIASDDTVDVWDVLTGAAVLSIPGHAPCAYSPDGRFIAAGSGDKLQGPVKLWNAQTGEDLLTFASAGAILACAFSPDGTQLLLGGIDRQKQLTLWDTRSGMQVGEFKGHVVSAWCCSYSGDGRRIISAEGSKGFIAVWDTETRSQLFRKFYRGNAAVKCSLSPDGRTVAVLRQDDTVELWDVDDDTELATLITNLKEIWGFQPLAACTYSPDGHRMLSAAQDGALRVWSVDEIAHVSAPQHTGRIEELRFAPDGRRFLSRSTGARRNDNKQQTMLWDAETRSEILPKRYENGQPEWDVDTASFDPAPTEKGSLRARGTGPMLEISDTATGAVTDRFKVRGTVTAFAWGEHGLIVVGDSVGFLYFLRLREGSPEGSV